MSLKQIPHVRYGSSADIGALMGVVRFLTVSDRAGHAASASTMLRSGFETTNRNEGRRLFGLATRTADSNSLKAFRFIVAMLPLW
jgi:hypothetical protein